MSIHDFIEDFKKAAKEKDFSVMKTKYFQPAYQATERAAGATWHFLQENTPKVIAAGKEALAKSKEAFAKGKESIDKMKNKPAGTGTAENLQSKQTSSSTGENLQNKQTGTSTGSSQTKSPDSPEDKNLGPKP